MERFFIHLPDQDLAYLPEGTAHFRDYIEAVSWAWAEGVATPRKAATCCTTAPRSFFMSSK